MKRPVSRRRWLSTAVAAATVVAAACGGVRYPKSYLLDLQTAAPQRRASPRVLGHLVVRDFQCPEYLCDGRIVYRPTTNEVGFYEYHRWAMSPRQMITDSIAASIRARGLFTSVTLREVDTDTALLFTGRIERFEEVDRGEDVHALCALSGQLTDARTRSVIWSGSESATVPVAQRDVPGVVSSLAAATRAAVDALVASLERQLIAAGSAQ